MSKDIKLTSLTKNSGCAAKIGPGVLHSVLSSLPKFEDENLIVGFDTSDDACVYKINDDTVVIKTVDFFPPMVDDPYTFGQVAAANALSDVYAMGGNPSIAMNLICFPSCLDISIMREILAGGYDKVKEAGAVIAGGHTIADPTPKYGLCVSGFARPEEILSNSNAKTGDVIILTKPLGIGIMNTAAKAELIDENKIKEVTSIMSTLNKYAKECTLGLEIHSCTDVTGFGLIGHSYEMASGSKKTIEIFSESIPIIDGALDYAKMGIIPEGMYNNLDYLKDKFAVGANISQELQDVLIDPQTSGGLLLSLPEKQAKEFLSRIENFTPYARIIGQVLDKGDKPIVIK
ncbi:MULTISPECIES: selenide, water dikinase SelD [Clostridium]|uniref:Selenide, water dikinase n=1 Tax=Clostridium botulinum (strain Eklund 17B / Type B) TaxID=935198 RepID=SELD_CLOBB|nr:MULTISPECIES: selenide, water dikinase SelD [Clostridium]B2TKP6.1 RecName: Full=Selenide, water dikinase; AltName: Full=Selenium donor protein; AltName: Full=Selenophosphate synthase [Clostridium botulinum B str. Eklund 17B (NRP)]MBN1050980.1 selenide, water dikinase SelD [Clostridium botulinum]ACD24854.1 selenide, water dikinase [Clostridium botulinum B str. Eklund 17B (NRP)]MBY6976521.1 selenide, water dikinase SelD [Clostridium botulinum]MBY7001546.1 selenide, water dikinase SelD [Clostr